MELLFFIGKYLDLLTQRLKATISITIRSTVNATTYAHVLMPKTKPTGKERLPKAPVACAEFVGVEIAIDGPLK